MTLWRGCASRVLLPEGIAAGIYGLQICYLVDSSVMKKHAREEIGLRDARCNG